MPHFEREAAKERRRNEVEGGLREITHQQRLEAVREFVEEVGCELGVPL